MADLATDALHDMISADLVSIVLAGGRGSRLYELTERTCKPALPFARRRRIVDFTMENIVRSGLRKVIVASQYRAEPLDDYVQAAWAGRLGADALMVRRGSEQTDAALTYTGTADAVWKNRAEIDAAGAREVLVLSADHVYEMDYRPLVAAHRASGAKITVAAQTVPREAARGFGVIAATKGGLISDFVEKPAEPPALPGQPDLALASMGIYICDWAWLRDVLARDAQMPASGHDFGHDILPQAVAVGDAFAWIWAEERGRPAFWRDVGTLDALRETALLFEAGEVPCALPSPDLSDLEPVMSRFGMSTTVGGLRLFAPLHSPQGRSGWGVVEESVLMDGARLSPGCRLTRVLVAPGVTLPEGLVVGEDPFEDARWFRVTPGGTTLVTTQMLSRRAAMMPRKSGAGPFKFIQQMVS